MNCPKCQSGNTFNRHKYMLCLACGHTFPREKTAPSVTDYQLQVQSLQAELAAEREKNDLLTIALSRIAEHVGRGLWPDSAQYFELRNIAREALGMEQLP